MKLLACLVLFSGFLGAQTGETAIYRAVLLPANEVPAVNNTARAIADVVTSVVRDASGQIVSGNIDLLLRTTLPAANSATRLNLHNGNAGQNAAVALSSGLTSSNAQPLQSGADSIHIAIPVGTNARARRVGAGSVEVLPEYDDTDRPTGVDAGQLAKAGRGAMTFEFRRA